jgi:alpha-1,3-rhamnosyl/mannosyltransferase
VRFFERNFHRGLGRCAHYFAISDAARQEIVAALGIPPEKITRTYMGVRPGLGPLPRECVREALNRLGLPSQYLLYLGTLEPRKNVLTLLRAYCDLPAGLRERFPMLLVGGLGWNADELADYLDAVARPRGVLRLGYLPDEALAAVYNGARALAFPSLYEGFGLPPVEMLACGGAVLASAIPPVVETAGAAAQLVEPLDVAAWRDALRRVCEDDDWWRSLRRGAVEAARPFTWEQCAADTLAGYRRVLGPSGEASGRRKAG